MHAVRGQAAARAHPPNSVGDSCTAVTAEAYRLASRIEDELEQAANKLLERLLPTAPLSVSMQCARGYQALAAAHAAAGVAVLALAALAPGLLLPQAEPSGSSLVLLGCLAASFLRAASALLFLTESSQLDELCTWRHQRLNLALFAASALAALSSLCCVLNAAPLASALLIALPCATAAISAYAFRAALSCSPTGYLFSWAVDWESPAYTARTLLACIRRDLGTLPGTLLLLSLALATTACASVLLSSLVGPSAPSLLASPLSLLGLPLLPGLPASGFGTAGWALRQAAGCSGMLLLASLAHTLLESAPSSVRAAPLELVRAAFLGKLREESRLRAAVHPAEERFVGLNVTLLLAAAVQAFVLVQVRGEPPLPNGTRETMMSVVGHA
jgi:hypothetical protein